MSASTKQQALLLLRQALRNPQADFREGQWEAIESIIEDKARLLVVQRTGWGKSLVYFLATRLLRDRGTGPTLLISPLLALMRNQIDAASRLNIKAATINSSNTEEWPTIQAAVLQGNVDILLISPERLANQEFRENVLLPISQRLGLFVVDEAHCISDWGHDFRPDYRRIVRILQALPPTIPVLATTATANNRVVNDIIAQLGDRLQVSRGTLARESLRLQNIYLPSQAVRMAWLAEILPKIPGSGIIYTLTVRDADRVANWLKLQHIDCAAYHSSSEEEERLNLESRLLNNQIKALVATTALGMGFDKPDLSFVIHYQRPGSVVHYYQQVGRAGRAVETAYGILLSGNEDQEITDYFINTAFPPDAHVEQVLGALEQTDGGLSTPALEQRLNLSRSQIEKVLKMLSVETPSPVIKIGSKWNATPVNYQINKEKIVKLTQIRRTEQQRMLEYMQTSECLMAFLARELDDPHHLPCGKCASCVGQPLLPTTASLDLVNQAVMFLRRSDQVIEPRKKFPANAFLRYNWITSNIPLNWQAKAGRALCLWGDAGWGELVKRGKYHDNYLDDTLVQATVDMLHRWQPQPHPTWVTAVPSLNRPELVPDFAERLAAKLGLPFVPAIIKIRDTKPQKEMQNSYQQASNLDGAFRVDQWSGMNGAVLLVDDVVDSRWTFTVLAALLRSAGSGPVFPLALAINSLS
ncbi:RecQ family ATP-dependent DNA helicase [[Phormidium] sp. ETS-05]|uniref:RecQ family ATP-dependent DNA helicase n=1 Tax=[Phormidium] sp. ETS-05 TaxID=222819 RepID=UPI0018EEF986|nr:RecQ family ATP-dependent DNA helicase [[Phormidium] sp. ETS-05]